MPPNAPENKTPRTRVSLAVSVDGFVAEHDGGFDFLHDFPIDAVMGPDYLNQFGAIVMGRRTYDQLRAMPEFGWPYAGTPVFVMTSRPLPGDDPDGVTAHPAADASQIRSLCDRARQAAGDRDVWIFGGASSIAALEQADAIDRWELAVVPRRLHRGIPLFVESTHQTTRWELTHCEQRPLGVVELHYEPATINP